MASGHVEQRSKDGWTIVIDYGRKKDPSGKVKQDRKFYTYRNITKSKALEILHNMLSDINRGKFVEPVKITLGEYLDKWIKQIKVSDRTREDYEGQIKNHIKPILGQINFTEVRPDDIRRLYTELRKSLSESTIRHTHIVLHSAFGQAVQDGDLFQNPVDAVKAPVPDTPPKVVLSQEETTMVLSHAFTMGRPRKRNGKKWLCTFYELFRLALATGMRRGELLALRWQEVDLTGDVGLIRVERTLNKVKVGDGIREVKIKPPKSKKSNRTIPIDEETTQMLRDLRDRNPHDLVFCHDDGSHLDPTTVTDKFREIAEKTGIPSATFHSQRHTYVTTGIEQGIDPFTMQELAGHENISTTQIYVHIADDRKLEAAKKIGSALLNSGKQQMSSKNEGELQEAASNVQRNGDIEK